MALTVTHPHSVSSKILALRIETGEITRGKQEKYVRQAGDEIKLNNESNSFKRATKVVYRDKKPLGILIDSDTSVDYDIVRTFDTLTGPDLDEQWAKQAANYSVNGVRPTNVFIKSKVADSARVGRYKNDYDYAMEHTIFLELPEAMAPGESYDLEFKGDQLDDLSFEYSPEKVRSEAVHISHVGFHPEDLSKVAFLSTWMGPTGKGLSYKPGQKFWLVNEKTGEKVFSGEIEISKKAGEKEDDKGRNYNGTDVYIADFSDFQQEGKFKVVVEDVGTSFAFDIGKQTWEDTFQIHMEGLFAHRSGIKKTREFSEYTAPASFNPANDEVKVYQSGAQVINTRTGLAKGVDMFPQLNEQLTDEVVPDLYGGWMDAGDWDRSTQHIDVARKLLELGEMFPEYFTKVDLTIPESKNQVADVIDEALWGVDFFQRLQTQEGGVRGGIESASHPLDMETSWQESLKIIAYAPDIWTSYQYAGVAARAAHVVKDIDPARAQGYLDSALKAMNWAETENNKNPNQYKSLSNYWELPGERNLAAAELYRATGDQQWHDLFLDSTVFTKANAKASQNNKFAKYDQRDAAFVYARTERPVDGAVQANARAGVIQSGDKRLAAINNTGFKWSKDPGAPFGWGANDGSTDRSDVLRAHFLSGEKKYLSGAVLASQFIGGANPDNVSYTTGIGPRQPDSVHHLDSNARGLEAPKGITIYGPADLTQNAGGHSSLREFGGIASTELRAWPTTEAFFDVHRYIPGAEYTITETIGPNAYATGYFAASNAKSTGSSPTPQPPNPQPSTPQPPTPELPVDPSSTPGPAFSRRRYEAENLELQGFETERIRGAKASGGSVITLEGTAARWGRAKGIFDGADGQYRVSVGYFDENDGRARGQVRVAGQKTTLRFDQQLSSDTATPATRVRKVIHKSIELKTGDKFELAATQNREEYGRFDFIRFDPVRSRDLVRNARIKADAAEIEIAKFEAEKTANQTDAQALTPAPAPSFVIEGAPTRTSNLSKLVSAPSNNLLLDLSAVDLDGNGEVDAQVQATFTTGSKAGYDNTVGFYAVEDASGRLTDGLTGKTLNPGDANYARVALTQRVSELDLTRETESLTAQLEGGQLLAPFLVANATVEDALAQSAALRKTYFAFEAANADGFQHVQGATSKTGSSLSFEDLWGGGDQNFTDFMVTTELSVA